MSDSDSAHESSTEERQCGRGAGSARQARRQMQLLFVSGMCLAVGMLLPFAWDHGGSMSAVDWLRIVLGICGAGVAGASVVIQARRP